LTLQWRCNGAAAGADALGGFVEGAEPLRLSSAGAASTADAMTRSAARPQSSAPLPNQSRNHWPPSAAPVQTAPRQAPVPESTPSAARTPRTPAAESPSAGVSPYNRESRKRSTPASHPTTGTPPQTAAAARTVPALQHHWCKPLRSDAGTQQ